MLKGLDHVVLVVLDLDAAVADHRTRGFTVTPGGVHAGGMTHNALVGFQDGTALGDLVAKPPEDGGRTRSDGLAIAWRVARLVPPLPFVIEDLTARELRVPGGDAARHANG